MTDFDRVTGAIIEVPYVTLRHLAYRHPFFGQVGQPVEYLAAQLGADSRFGPSLVFGFVDPHVEVSDHTLNGRAGDSPLLTKPGTVEETAPYHFHELQHSE